MAPDSQKAEFLKAKTERELQEARKVAANAAVAEILLDREQEKRANELAANERNRVYVFDSDVSESAVKRCITQLTAMARQEPGCAIELQINSPGGSIFDGFALIDFLRDLRKNGHQITVVGFGMVASMAGVILQAADRRVMGANSLLLIHEGSLGAVGDFGKVEDRVKLMGIMHARILELFESRAKPINAKTTKAFIKRNWQRKDWWMTANDALKLGFVDEVR